MLAAIDGGKARRRDTSKSSRRLPRQTSADLVRLRTSRGMPNLQQSLCVMLAVLPCALALGGCSTAFVQPETYAASAAAPVVRHTEVNVRRRHVLLAQQAPPDCEYKGTDADAVDKDLWQRLKLDYERHCFQQAEALVRNRLHQLQVSGLCEIRAVRHRARFVRFAPSF